jgi:hypothetical protein
MTKGSCHPIVDDRSGQDFLSRSVELFGGRNAYLIRGGRSSCLGQPILALSGTLTAATAALLSIG